LKLLLAFAALVFISAAAPTTHVLREQAWTQAGETADLAHTMTRAPQECLAAPATGLAQIEAGRALFRSPTLLGGPVARAGISCHACHSNGRVNEHFFLPELTDRAGAADVTSEWASQMRGDGVMNAIDIPDLAGVGERTALGRTRDPSLEHFVHGVIVEEFQGAPPPPATMQALLSYLRALNADACVAAEIAITLRTAADDVRRAVSAAQTMGDRTTSGLLLAAAQDAMGRIVERLPPRAFGTERRRLETLSRELTAMRSDDAWRERLPAWRVRFDGALTRIARREQRTYFDENTLRAALRR
jgi:hypothetical protein